MKPSLWDIKRSHRTEDQICTVCGFVLTPALGHNFADAVVDADGHWHSCDRCGHTDGTDSQPLCVTDKYCPVCNELTVPANGQHVYSDWKTDENNHWKECDCGDVQNLEAHVPGESDCESDLLCSICNYLIADATGHTDAIINESPATCTEEGYITYGCTVCGTEHTETLEILGHSYEELTRVEPTCTEAGSVTYKCSLCEDEYTDSIAELGHTYEEQETLIPPTCTSVGSIVYKCSVCEDSYTETNAPMLDHNYVAEETVDATCTDAGRIVYKCSACDDSYTEPLEMLDHSYEAEETVDATCTDAGYIVYKCSVCDDSYREDIPAAGHDMYDDVDNWIPSTCVVPGHMVEKCRNCEYSEVGAELPLRKVHYYEIQLNTVAPTCVDEGYTVYKCRDCEATENRDYIPALGHTGGDTVVENNVEPDCLNSGSYDNVVYCSVCNAELSRNTVTVDALGHDLEHTEALAPTCTEIGWNAYDTCQRDGCGYTTYVELPALGHTGGDIVIENNVEPDCLNSGSYDNVVYCSVCNAELSRNTVTVDALGHDLEHIEAKAPTCTEIGWDAYDTCQRDGCGYTTYVEKAALGHTDGDVVVENNVAPDCLNTGSYDNVVYCTVCNAELSRDTVTVDALGHDLEHIEAKAPTCTEIGWDAYDACRRNGCGYTTYVEKAALGHTGGDIVIENSVAPDCLNTGSYDNVVYCSVCNAELSRDTVTVDALGHDLEHTDAEAPTCTEIGWDAYDTCLRDGCGYTTYVEKSALGHNAVTDEAVAPTCTESGLTEGSHCSVCNEILEAQEVSNALGHSYGSWIPSEDALGEHFHECTHCKKIDTSDCKWNGGVITTHPTFETPGVKTFTCTVCGGTKTADIDKLIPDKVDELTSSGNDEIKITIPNGSEAILDKNTIVVVDKVTDEISEETKDRVDVIIGQSNTSILASYDISMVLNGITIQPGGKIEVTLPAPENAASFARLQVVYIDDSGNVSTRETRTNGDGTVTFVTDHFSRYSIIGIGAEEELPLDIIIIAGAGLVLLILIIIIIASVSAKRKRKKRNAKKAEAKKAEVTKPKAK